MAKEEHIEFDGEITHCGAGGSFKVVTTDGHEINARLSGKMRKNKIRVVLGDQVKVNVSPYDASRGVITFRAK